MSASPSSSPSRSTNIPSTTLPATRTPQPPRAIAARTPIPSRAAPQHETPSPTAPRIPSPSPSSSNRGTIRKADDDHEESPMAKRQRRVSLESASQRHLDDSRSSPSSDSQSGMADTEVDQKKVGQSASSMGSTTQKKKRTRTLTTPHQAAVLHALLAQSRFPTTAMREEVGRAIGLSARKVQIWFQNQRQKARRPRSQGDAQAANRPPQYGPYPSTLYAPATGAYSPSTYPGIQTHLPHVPGPSGLRSPSIHRPELAYHGSSFMGAATVNAPPAEGEALLGPGVPGSEMSSRHHSTLQTPRDPYAHPSYPPRYASPSPNERPGLPLLRPVSAHPTSWRREYDPSRTLPPLIQSRPTSSSHLYPGQRPLSSYRQASSPPPIMAPIQHHRSPSPSQERRFAHQVPDLFSAPAPPTTLPPPFTLQPAPQWEPTPSTTFLRPSSSGNWSRPVSRSAESPSLLAPLVGRSPQTLDDGVPERSLQSPYARLPLDRERTPPLVSPSSSSRYVSASQLGVEHREPSPPPPPSRAGRYDPIRETFIPFSSDVATPNARATQSSPEGGREHARRRSESDGDH